MFCAISDRPALRKHVYGHIRTTKAKISLRIRAVWSGLSLSDNRIIGYYRTANARMIVYACIGSESVHFANVRMSVFAWRDPSAIMSILTWNAFRPQFVQGYSTWKVCLQQECWKEVCDSLRNCVKDFLHLTHLLLPQYSRLVYFLGVWLDFIINMFYRNSCNE